MKGELQRVFVIITTLLISQTVIGQIVINNNAPYNSPSYLVDNVLLGNGVTASNVLYTGDGDQIGFFNGINTNLNLDSGIVMSSGDINEITGTSASTDFFNPGDNDILSIAQINRPNISSSYDAAKLEFDFFVTGDTVEFKFVFASEEYTSYINTDYNDAFGFFLSGPGISGPYSSPANFPNGAVNVALVPGTSTPISISTIYDDPFQNPTSVNGQYYIDNTGSSHAFNGFTTVITAKYPVVCGSEYHFKFVIADCSDGTLDSGVFLGARSLGSEGVSVSSFSSNGTGIIGEACGNGGFVFASSNTSTADTIAFNILGNADMGSDYNTFNDTIILPVGVSSDTIWVEAYQDMLAENLDTITISLIDVEGCALSSLYIQSIEPMEATTLIDSVNICFPETAQLAVDVSGGMPPYQYSWTNSPTTNDTIIVAPEVTTSYIASITDQCQTTIDAEESIVWVQCPLIGTNVFTPNKDGNNDYFTLINLDDYPHPKLTVYNRWGKVVYVNEDYQNDWNGTHYKSGKDVDSGVYYYVVEPNSEKYMYNENKDESIRTHVTGYVHIMR